MIAHLTHHALTALDRQSPGRRRLIIACAEEYLAQVDRRRLPRGLDEPIGSDRRNRSDAYRNRRGSQMARMLGIAVNDPGDGRLVVAARAVLAADASRPVAPLAALMVAAWVVAA